MQPDEFARTREREKGMKVKSPKSRCDKENFVLIRVLAVLAHILSFSVDNSPMHIRIHLCVLVSCMCANFIG
jgi:hypothetical protein